MKQRFQVAKGGVEASYPGEGRFLGEFFGDLKTPKCPNWRRSELNPVAGNRETEDAFEVELQVWRGLSKGRFLKFQNKNLTC